MIALRIASGDLSKIRASAVTGLNTVVNLPNLSMDCGDLTLSWSKDNGDRFFLLGNVVGIRGVDGALSSPSLLSLQTEYLENPSRIPEVEGRFVVCKVAANGACEVWTDQFGRVDVYWQSVAGGVVLGTGLNLLPIATTGGTLDLVGVAHALTVYGARPAKQHTLYKDVQRLGVNQGVSLTDGRSEVKKRAFKPTDVGQYKERDLHRYTELFLEAVRARASVDGNIVSLSSGWDSTSILAALVHLFGNRKVRAVIGRMRYSERSGIINQFEIDRATKLADYFGVKLEIVEQDYRENSVHHFDEAKEYMRSQQFGVVTALSQWRIAKSIAERSDGGEVLFTGEASDGAHNLGFSQFVSIFHSESQEFREYADKMAGYLFGPTFLAQMLKGGHEQDPIWQLYRGRNANTKFDALASGKKAITAQFLSSFFLRGGRMPLYSLDNARMLTEGGRNHYGKESQRVYLEDIVEQVNGDNLYGWYLHLYNTFHWQSATVLSRDYAAEAHGLRSAHPFMDGGVIDFLAGMPESWGRGLDFNPTKYPLKWMLRNKIDYPYHLQVGPHSYTYDVKPDFSLLGELLHASALKNVFKDALRSGDFLDMLDGETFDRPYIEGIVNRYVKGEELRGQEMNDLGTIATHSAVGVYAR